MSARKPRLSTWRNTLIVVSKFEHLHTTQLRLTFPLLRHERKVERMFAALKRCVELDVVMPPVDIYVLAGNPVQIVPIESPQFGRVMAVCIGAMMVGSIKTTVQTGDEVKRGEEFGYFAFGGCLSPSLCGYAELMRRGR